MAIGSHPEPVPSARKGARPLWVRRLGVVGFVFFLVKGLLWLTVPVVVYFFGAGE